MRTQRLLALALFSVFACKSEAGSSQKSMIPDSEPEKPVAPAAAAPAELAVVAPTQPSEAPSVNAVETPAGKLSEVAKHSDGSAAKAAGSALADMPATQPKPGSVGSQQAQPPQPAAPAKQQVQPPQPSAPAKQQAKEVAVPAPQCPSLAHNGLAPGTYVSQGSTAMKLTLVEGCKEPSVLLGPNGEVKAKRALEVRKLGSRTLRTLRMAEGDVCGEYGLAPDRSGAIRLVWLPDPEASAHRAAKVAKACRAVQAAFVRQVQAPAAPAPPAAPASGQVCDLQKIDWKNFDYGDVKLKNGVDASVAPEFADAGVSKLSKVYYADLDGAPGLEALVVVVCPGCGPRMSSLGTLYGFTSSADCTARKLGSIEADGFVEGKLSGRKFIFKRTFATPRDDDGPGLDSERVECGVVKGKLVATKVTRLEP